MIPRRFQETLQHHLERFPAVVLLGPRQVGKTTLAQSLLKSRPKSTVTYLDLELISDLAKLQDAESYLKSVEDRLVVIDEVQRQRELFPILRALIDQNRRPGRFLLLGSASPGLLRQSSESLAGRVIYLELHPLDLLEVEKRAADPDLHWWRGGYPEAYLAQDDQTARLWHQALIKTYLERDVPQLGFRVPGSELQRFFSMLAHTHGQIWNASRMASNFGVSDPTVRRYLSIFEETFLVRTMRPWHQNLKKRLVKSPKVYLRDSGILHTLLPVADFDQLQGHPQVGSSWEGYVLEQIAAQLEEYQTVETFFYRTHGGAELDLLLTRGMEVMGAVGVKMTSAPTTRRGLHEARSDLGDPPVWIIYRGRETYPLGKGIQAAGLSEFLAVHLPGLLKNESPL